MEHVDELIAGEALYALDPAGRAELERHLAGCERCRRRLREMEAVASTLAYTAPPAAAPDALRGRLMAALDAESDRAPAAATGPAARPRAERLRRPWPARLRLALTPALAAAAVALLVWNISLHNDLSSINSRISHDRVAALPGVGNVLVSNDGRATLYAALAHAPAGKTYEAWVIAGGTARPAGLFAGGSEQVSLTRPALAGDTVAVTLEPAGGSPQPTSKPLAAATLSRA